MEITASDVNKLRQQTGAGMMDCKKALAETNGNFEEAIVYLRKKGQKVSALRSDKEAKEGVIIAQTSADNKRGVIVYLSCETDFVAKNTDFVLVTASVADAALKNNAADAEQVLNLSLNGVTVNDVINEQVAKIGEKIELKRFEKMEAEYVQAYIHAGNKIGVLVGLNKPKTSANEPLAKDVAMQVAAMSPLAVDKDGISQTVIDKEIEIAKEQIRAEGKPENMLEKIAQGKLQKFFKENTLVNQQFVKDNSKTVEQAVKEIDKDLKVLAFKRVQLGK